MSSDSEDSAPAAAAAAPEVTDLSNPEVVTKYKLAAQIANQTLTGILTQLVPGKKVVEICEFGDTVIAGQVALSYKAKKIEKGVAFPTCISVNEVVCHYSPFAAESIELKAGDSVKIDLGVHIDGYIAVVAHTTIVAADPATPVPTVTGPQADVFAAAYAAAEAAAKTIKPGNTNTQVTAVIKQVAEAFGVQAVTGTFSQQMKQFVIDGNKVIIQREEEGKKVEEITFEPNEVYAVDICFSTGEGKPKDTDIRTTVLRRVVDRQYGLKMKSSRYVLSEVNRRYPTLPFTLRALDESQARMGVVECVRHGLLAQYPVVSEREGSYVAHFKFTVLLLPSGTSRITGLPLPPFVSSEKTVPDALKAALAGGGGKKKRRGGGKKKSGGAAAAGAGPAAGEEESGEDA